MNKDNNTIFKLYTEAAQEQPQVYVHANGIKEWWLHGKLHREGAPAVEWADGYKAWWLHGKRHREDAPAVEYVDGTKAWWLHGKRHREDGPAIEYVDGYKEWYLHGEHYKDAKDWAKAVLKDKGEPSDEQHVAAFLYNLNKKKVNELM